MANVENIDARLGAYQVAAQHWVHAEQVRWALLYDYLMASTILLLAWATIFASDRPARQLILLCLALAGALISVLWIALGARSNSFVKMYVTVGIAAEEQIQPLEAQETERPFKSAENHRQHSVKGIARIATSSLVMKCVPSVFAILYAVLAYVSLTQSVAHTSTSSTFIVPGHGPF